MPDRSPTCRAEMRGWIPMDDGVAGVVLAAGSGSRLRPLTLLRPKPLCPVGNVPLVDLAMERVRSAVADAAVNIHHGRDAMIAHLEGRAHLSFEEERALGTAGALGQLRTWLDERAALVVNADAWCPGSLRSFVDGWDRERTRLLLVGDRAFGPASRVAAALMPWSTVALLAAEPSGLYEVVWAPAHTAGRLEVVCHEGAFIDCGTPGDYLAANLATSGGASVIGSGAVVEGSLDQCVVWAGVRVGAHEALVRAIRPTDRMTVLVR